MVRSDNSILAACFRKEKIIKGFFPPLKHSHFLSLSLSLAPTHHEQSLCHTPTRTPTRTPTHTFTRTCTHTHALAHTDKRGRSLIRSPLNEVKTEDPKLMGKCLYERILSLRLIQRPFLGFLEEHYKQGNKINSLKYSHDTSSLSYRTLHCRFLQDGL